MKIAQLVSNFYPVTPRVNNAIYSHVSALSDGLIKMGQSVDLFAAGGSISRANLHAVTPGPVSQLEMSSEHKKYLVHELISECYSEASKFDIIHSHFTLLSSFYSSAVETPTVQSIHSPITEDLKPFLLRHRNNRYISFSLAQRRVMPELNWIANIYHGVDMNVFAFNPEPQEYFLFLGRITEDKAPHLAIEAAKAAGVKLLIAGRSYPSEGYWHEKIEKHIDGVNIRYVGEADFDRKITLLQGAKALLSPVQAEETFGLAMIEAMACGTPVIGWDRGSVAEVVAHNQSGFVVDSMEKFVEAIKSIDNISREATRKRAEIYFSTEKMVSGYKKVYERVIAETQFRKQSAENLKRTTG